MLGQLREGSDVADDLQISRRDRKQARVVPGGAARGGGCPSPSSDVVARDVGELAGGALQERGGGRVSFGCRHDQAVKQQVDGLWSGRLRESLDGTTDFEEDVSPPEWPERAGGEPGDEIGLAGEA